MRELLQELARIGPIEHLARRIQERVAEPAFQQDAEFLEWLLPLMDLYARYFDAEVHGLEKVPREGGVLVVGNHSGAVLVPDTSALISAWHRHFGMDRHLLGLALDTAFVVPSMESLMRKLGQMPANHENATAALERGDALLVYPGGAHEAFRPWTDRNQVDFGGHKGFVRLALRTGVPVVPVVGHGGHESTFMLARGDSMIEAAGLSRLRMGALPLAWQVPWGVSIALLPGVPLPAKITVEVCEPLDWSAHGPAGADEPEVVGRCYDEITSVMQTALSRMAETTPYPLLTRMRALMPAWPFGQS
jgi:1-acyl-sn-glycerol-3-phosphate acyltransferase